MILEAVRIFQLIDLAGIICNLLLKKRKDESWNYLTIADWVYYFGLGTAFILSFGLYGIVEDIQNDDGSLYLFLVAVCTGVMFSLMQKIWCIKYNSDTLIFRNSFGCVKKYNIQDIEFVEKENKNEIRFKGKKITEWPILLINYKQDIEFYKFINMKKR